MFPIFQGVLSYIDNFLPKILSPNPGITPIPDIYDGGNQTGLLIISIIISINYKQPVSLTRMADKFYPRLTPGFNYLVRVNPELGLGLGFYIQQLCTYIN